jgi:hypothetical protein
MTIIAYATYRMPQFLLTLLPEPLSDFYFLSQILNPTVKPDFAAFQETVEVVPTHSQ